MTLKEKLLNHKATVGSWVSLGHPAIVEIMCKAGFEWVVIDLEHSVIDLFTCENLIRTARLSGTPALVRLTSNDPQQIKRVMDAGASGVIVPMVKTGEDVKLTIDSVYYPPQGKRGVGLARAQGYGASFQEYKSSLERQEPVIIVQIEHIEAVRNISAILSHELVDGFMVGPYDLSGSLGTPGDFENPQYKQAIDEILAMGKKLKKSSGIHLVEPSVEELGQKIHDGFQFVAYSVDIRMLDRESRKAVQFLKKDGII
ncbi:MAG: HpcH/HpaI aldolase/citrate lyase family protein [Bdellovibrionales bacterium]